MYSLLSLFVWLVILFKWHQNTCDSNKFIRTTESNTTPQMYYLVLLTLFVWLVIVFKWYERIFFDKCQWCGQRHVPPTSVWALTKKEDLIHRYNGEKPADLMHSLESFKL